MLHAHVLGALSVRCSLPHHPFCRASQVLKGLKAEDKLVEAYSMVSGEAERMKKMAAEKMANMGNIAGAGKKIFGQGS